jgi:predicted nucleic acid-binding protein
MISAFARRRISGEINADDFAKFESDMNEDWEAFERTTLIESVTSLAGKLAAAYGLRGADSVHLAAASRMAFALMDRNIRTIFVSSDRDLNEAASQVGFEVLDPLESACVLTRT